jgi:short-subunit dehydrogenase
MARQAHAQGHTVYGVARREDKLQELQGELGDRFASFVCDVADTQAVIAVCEKLPETPDVVIMNAGYGLMDSRKKFDIELHEYTYKVNYFGALAWIHALLPKFTERKSGKFVAISSLAATRGLPKAAAYGSSKAALSTTMESLRLTYRRSPIQFLTVQPGFIHTPMTKGNKGMVFVWKAERAARYILKKVQRGKLVISFPLPMRFIMRLLLAMPPRMYRFIVRG